MTCAPVTLRRSAARPSDLVGLAVGALGRVGLAALVIFHAWLLGSHLMDGRAFEPATAVRWVLAVLVLAGFRALSRRGLPVFFGRRAVALWLLVVVIHCSAAWDGGAAAALDRAIPESVTVLAQVSAAAGLAAALSAALLAAARTATRNRRVSDVPAFIAGLPSTGFVLQVSPRPPPLA